MIRRPEKDETGQVLEVWNACFPQEPEAATAWYFHRVYAPENTLCYFEKGVMAACVQTVPYSVLFGGRKLDTMTLTGVSTLPAYRGRGFARDLMKAAIADMRIRGVSLCFLYTDIPDFYRQYGWETCTANRDVRFPALPEGLPQGYRAGDIEPPVAQLNALYEDWMEGVNGHVLRSEELWERRLDELRSDGARFTSVYRENELCAFAASHVDDRVEWGEAYWRGEKSLAALRHAFGKEIFTTVPLGCPLPDDCVTKTRRGNMFRLADAALLLGGMPVRDEGKVNIGVNDPFMDSRNVYVLESSGGFLQCRETEGEADLQLDAAALIRIASGVLRAVEAYQLGLVGGDRKAVLTLDRWFSAQNNFMFEIC